MLPKYARLEIERRWIVSMDRQPSLEGFACRIIEDKYLSGGRLRTRKVTSPGQAPVFKLGKKYERAASDAEPVVSVYLTEAEYESLVRLPGRVARKRRYALAGGSLDVYEHPAHPHAIFEVEFGSTAEALAFKPPSFVSNEVSRDSQHSGFAMSQA